MGQHRGVEQRHVGRVREHDRVDERVVGEAAVGSQPHPLPGRQGALAVGGQPVDVADVDGPGPVDPRPDVPLVIPDPLAQGGQLLGRGDVGHLERVLEARLLDLEAGRHVEDRLAVLDGDDPAGRERPPVADAIHLVEDRQLGIAGPQEIGVERVDSPVGLDRAGGGHQRLAGHLPAEDPLAVLVRRDAPEDVDLDRLEVEQLDQIVDGVLRHAGKSYRRATVRVGVSSHLGFPAVTEDTGSFPDGFVWGTATAAHQIEGGNWNNDWWAWEHAPASPCAEPSGDACDSWDRWDDDVALVADLGFGSYRFSVEWSRIEPEDGEWSYAAVDHYRRQCEALLARGIEPTVTFHHFTTPRWLAVGQQGWEDPATADRFAAFCGRLAGELGGDLVRRACTINEPNIVATIGWLLGAFPPGKTDHDLRLRVNDVFVDAHRKAVDAIRAAAPGVPVGLT